MTITVVVWRLFVNERGKLVDKEFNVQAAQYVNTIESRTDELLIELTAYQSLFRASDDVNRAEFKTMFDEFALKAVTPGLRNVTFYKPVSASGLESFTAAVRADSSTVAGGYPGFTVHPAGSGGDHLVATYVEPAEAAATLLGYDAYTDPVRQELFDRARDTNTAVASPQVALEVPGNPRGLVVAVPAYRKDAPIGTVEERRAAFIGSIGTAFETEAFFSDVIPADVRRDFDLEVTDQSAGETLIYDSNRDVHDAGATADPHRDFTIAIGERSFRVHVHALSTSSIVEAYAFVSFSVLGIGVLISVLGAYVAYTLSTTRAQALMLASRMTHDIKRSTERYLELLESLPDPTILLDKMGRIVSINRATEELSGYRRDELIGTYFPKAGIIAPTSLPVALRNFAISLSGRTHAPYEVDMRMKDGSIRAFEVNSSPVTEQTKTVGVQVVLRDVTKRKEMLAQVARQAAELQRINRFMVGREIKMAELKQQIAQQGRTPSGER